MTGDGSIGRPRRPLAPATVLAAAACAIALAACGSSGKPSNGSSMSGGSAGIRFADCMRSHGVPNFPDPGAGGGVQIPGPINPQSPAFKSAQSACASLLPGPGGGHTQASEALKLRMLAESRCMRKHGLPSFPDPTASAPPPNTGFALAFGRRGSVIAIPTNLVNSPAFTRAAAACGLPGAGPHQGSKATFAP